MNEKKNKRRNTKIERENEKNEKRKETKDEINFWNVCGNKGKDYCGLLLLSSARSQKRIFLFCAHYLFLLFVFASLKYN